MDNRELLHSGRIVGRAEWKQTRNEHRSGEDPAD